MLWKYFPTIITIILIVILLGFYFPSLFFFLSLLIASYINGCKVAIKTLHWLSLNTVSSELSSDGHL